MANMDIASFGASGAVVAVVLFFLKFMREEGDKRDKSYASVEKTLRDLSEVTRKNTTATVNMDTYIQQRNGRDIKMHLELIEVTKKIPTKLQTIATAQSRAIIEAVKVRDVQLEVVADKVEHVKTDLVKDDKNMVRKVKPQ